MRKVSIIIPCYNQEKYIKKTIESALNQTYKNIEIICVNDASEDDSRNIIKKYTERFTNVALIDFRQNQGVIYARDYAIKMSMGDYILPLDGDDIISETFVEKAVEILDNNKEVGIVYSDAKYIGKKHSVIKTPEFSKELLLYKNYIHATAMYRKLDYLRTKGYNPNMNGGFEDWDLWLSFIELGLKGYRIDEVLFYFRIHNQSKYKTAQKNILALRMQIFKNHYSIYMKDERFIPDAFNKTSMKYLKYRKLFIFIIILAAFSFVLNIAFLIWLFK